MSDVQEKEVALVEPESNTIYKIQINYKSGTSMTNWFKELTIKTRGSDISQVGWKGLVGEFQILHLGVDNIESIWQLESKEVEDPYGFA